MSGKHRNWHKNWTRVDDNTLLHSTGLRVLIENEQATTDEKSIDLFRINEKKRGLPDHDILERASRLLREAADWNQYTKPL